MLLPDAERSAADVEGWLGEWGIVPVERAEREGVSSWDLVLDGRRRLGVRTTVILDPSLAAIVWVHYAPPIGTMFRKSYRKLLRWNDEFPFAKFAISDDERPVLTAEIPIERLDRDELAVALTRLLAICDRLRDESMEWLALEAPAGGEPVGRMPRNAVLFERYGDRLAELEHVAADLAAPRS